MWRKWQVIHRPAERRCIVWWLWTERGAPSQRVYVQREDVVLARSERNHDAVVRMLVVCRMERPECGRLPLCFAVWGVWIALAKAYRQHTIRCARLLPIHLLVRVHQPRNQTNVRTRTRTRTAAATAPTPAPAPATAPALLTCPIAGRYVKHPQVSRVCQLPHVPATEHVHLSRCCPTIGLRLCR